MPTKVILKLQTLLTLRDRLVRDRGGFEATYKEQRLLLGIADNAELFEVYQNMIGHLSTQINWRKFACYIGTAPFEHTSGTSVRGKTQVSHLANKQLKKLLHLAAISAIIHNKELRAYYLRRVSGGKSKMSTINVLRIRF